METQVTFKNQSFFEKGVEFWIGKIVKFSAQRSIQSGESWGWRYKVRIIGDYSNLDSVDDKDVHTAVALIPTTGGTGGAGKASSVRLTQGDVVFGAFLAPDNNFPVIIGALGRTRNLKKPDDTKLGNQSGYTDKQKAGLTEGQEHTGQDQQVTRKLQRKGEMGNGKTKESPTNNGLEKVNGGLSDENQIDAVPDPSLTKEEIIERPSNWVDKPSNELQPGETNDEILREVAQFNEQEKAFMEDRDPRPLDIKFKDIVSDVKSEFSDTASNLESTFESIASNFDESDLKDAMNATKEELDEAFDMF
tara:strand:- start:6909 stop:7823 length:915 start_codon:yes stop_codon:yes gene_type:complete